MLAVLGHVYAVSGLGEIEEAITCFEGAADARAGSIVYLKVEPMVDPLRAHPRFVSLMRRLNLGSDPQRGQLRAACSIVAAWIATVSSTRRA
jgi:hypothetical protein